jgi:hypothetical protein
VGQGAPEKRRDNGQQLWDSADQDRFAGGIVSWGGSAPKSLDINSDLNTCAQADGITVLTGRDDGKIGLKRIRVVSNGLNSRADFGKLIRTRVVKRSIKEKSEVTLHWAQFQRWWNDEFGITIAESELF